MQACSRTSRRCGPTWPACAASFIRNGKRSTSSATRRRALITDAGRRRFSDVFDVAARLAGGLDEARSALAETLDAYRGAEARQATEVTKVLTVYAAIMLPLSLIAGIFGMNFANLPLLDRSWGWIVAGGIMLAVALVSVGVFVSLGWVRRPSGRRTGRVLGRGLVEATLAPVQIVGAVVEMSSMPIRATGHPLAARRRHPRPAAATHDGCPRSRPPWRERRRTRRSIGGWSRPRRRLRAPRQRVASSDRRTGDHGTEPPTAVS
jgi:hypothetical protein